MSLVTSAHLIAFAVALTFDGTTPDSSLPDHQVPSIGGSSDRAVHVTMRVGSYFVLYEVSDLDAFPGHISDFFSRPVDGTHINII